MSTMVAIYSDHARLLKQVSWGESHHFLTMYKVSIHSELVGSSANKRQVLPKHDSSYSNAGTFRERNLISLCWFWGKILRLYLTQEFGGAPWLCGFLTLLQTRVAVLSQTKRPWDSCPFCLRYRIPAALRSWCMPGPEIQASPPLDQLSSRSDGPCPWFSKGFVLCFPSPLPYFWPFAIHTLLLSFFFVPYNHSIPSFFLIF